MNPRSCGLAALVLLLLPFQATASPPEPKANLASSAQAVLKTHCFRCHGQNGAAKGKFGYVLDRDKLVARNKVVPGSPGESELYQRVQSGEMPPPGKSARPSKDEVALLKRWIEAGAPGITTVARTHAFVPESTLQHRILQDLETINPRHRRFARYLTLTHLVNAGLSDRDLQTARLAVSKLLNSLSWHPRITRPTSIDAEQTIFRIDLRHYKWTAALWERLVSAYPYKLLATTPEARGLAAATGTELAALRGDWLVATAARPPLYQDLLQLPNTERALERLLQVDVPGDLKEETVMRAGFNDSGVSKNNRLIERHDSAYGAYWRSYDFSENTGLQNLFEHPLGPNTGETSFSHAGGEMIFDLPNGLHAYLLADGTGRRIDKGPVEIVSDPKRPDQRVETGVSCMTCHAHGLIPKADQVRAHVSKNAAAFTRADRETIEALYPPRTKMQALLDGDNRRYLKALSRIGVAPEDPEPVSTVTQRYEATLDLRTAAAELSLTPGDLVERLKKTPVLARVLGALRLKGGTVQRQVFQDGFAEMVRVLKLEEQFAGRAAPLAPAAEPFTGHAEAVRDIAFAPDGKRAASCGDDRTVRLWDMATGRELRCYEGHTDEATCVAFTPNGKHLLTGSRDRTIRLWDAASARELRRFRGHTDPVRAIAVSPDGRRAASAGEDGSVRIWDLASGKETHCLTGHARAVRAVAFSPDGRLLLSGGQDGTVRLWDTNTGAEIRRCEGHTRAVYSVAFSPDGRRALSGGDDRVVRLWDVVSGREMLRCQGHENAVVRVVFAPDGRKALSGSSQYRTADQVVRVWDLATGQQLQGLGAPEEVSVGCVAFAPDGHSALSGGSDRALRRWQWK